MKKVLIFLIFIILFNIIIAQNDSVYTIIKENNNYYKLFFSDSGEFLLKEKIDIINKDEQLFKNIIPYNWQLGLFGLWQGIYYGISIANAFNISDTRYKSLITASVPIGLFFIPPILIKDNIRPITIPVVDWGYRLGVGDYFLLRTIYSEKQFNNNDSLFSVICGLSEAWGGYYIVKNKDIPRRAGHFYATGALLGGAWGLGTGFVLNNLFFSGDSVNSKIIASSTLLSSQLIRFGAFKYFSNKSMYWKSFDSYIIGINSIILPAIMTDIYIYTNMDSTLSIGLITLSSMANTYLNYYIMNRYDIHFNDGNALLLFAGGILGYGLGYASVIITESDNFIFSQFTLGMLAGEAIVYYLKKDEIIYNGITKNMSFNIFPDMNKGVKASLKIDF